MRRNKWIIVDVSSRARPASHEPVAAARGRLVALVVDAMTEVFGTGGAEIRPAPSLGEGDHLRGIEGVASYGGGLVFVLDVRVFNAIAEAVALSTPPSAPFGAA